MLLLVLSLLPIFAAAAPSADAVAVCQFLHDEYPDYQAWDPLSIYGVQSLANAGVYNEINTIYWNKVNVQYRPTCAFFPVDAEQVSAAVKQLNKYSGVPFALKSGGHQFNPGFSATKGGVVISFNQNLASTIRSADGNSFEVGPGSRWGDVYKVTGETNQVVVGGRLADIGVGGFVLGGGLSYYSAQYGLACDNVLNFEVVLPNGTITNASKTQNRDLFWALKGGGNRFAIVTKFTLQAHPAGDDGQIWGGIRSYSGDDRAELFTALSNFISNYPDKKAAVIPTFNFAGPLVKAPMIFFFYDGATPPAGLFADFDKVTALSDDTKTRTYTDLTSDALGGDIQGFSTAARVNTFPALESEKMSALLEEHWQVFSKQNVNDSSKNIDIQVMTFTPQPLSVQIAKASQAQGPNALDLRPEYGDRTWVENDLIWLNSICDTACPDYLKDTADIIKNYQKVNLAGEKPTHYQSGDIDFVSNNPLFMNDAAYYQDVYSSYGATNKARLQQIQKQIDPDGFMYRQGGWKL